MNGIEGQRRLWIWLLGGVFVVAAIGAAVWFFVTPGEQPATPDDKPRGQSQREKPAEPLSVKLDGIQDGQSVTGEVEISLQVDDISRVVRAEYYIDGVFAAVTYAYPFSYTLNTALLSAGEHTITAKAFDKDGKSFNAAPVTITVTQAAASGSQSTTHKTASSTTPAPTEPSDDQQDTADTAPPSAPNLMLSANDSYTANLSWTASTDNTGVSGYQVYRDGAAVGSVLGASTTAYQDQTVVPGNTYEYAVKAIDAASNYSAFSNGPNITLAPTSIWISADSPQLTDNSSDSYELGVKFRPLVNGKVTGVKFYKAAGSTGTHVGNLWAGDGTHLADATFSGETASGWQQATFDTPVDVLAGTTYVVSYSVPNGGFGFTSAYFATEGITSQYLTAMASGVDGNNGMFNDDPGSFPGSSFNNTNYWVDALFMPNENAGGPAAKTLDTSSVYAGFPGSNNTGVPVGKRLPTRDRSIQIHDNGAIMENIDITGQVDILNDNIMIRNSKVSGFVYLDTDVPAAANWEFTVRDAEVNAGTNGRAAISLGNFTLERVNLRGGFAGALCVGNCTVEDSWLHGQYVPPDQDWHVNGFLTNGGSDMTIRGNTIVCDVPNNMVGGGCSGDLSLFGDFAAVRNVLIESNLFKASDGATYCVNLGYNALKPFGPNAENIDVINNIFERGTSGTCASVGSNTDYQVAGLPAPGNSWINNLWDDGAVVNPDDLP